MYGQQKYRPNVSFDRYIWIELNTIIDNALKINFIDNSLKGIKIYKRNNIKVLDILLGYIPPLKTVYFKIDEICKASRNTLFNRVSGWFGSNLTRKLEEKKREKERNTKRKLLVL